MVGGGSWGLMCRGGIVVDGKVGNVGRMVCGEWW